MKRSSGTSEIFIFQAIKLSSLRFSACWLIFSDIKVLPKPTLGCSRSTPHTSPIQLQ
jgi:hypothetical protein